MKEERSASSANPELIHIKRGRAIESSHRGSIAIWSLNTGSLCTGDAERPVYARSTIKLFQAIPLIYSGAAAAFGLNDRELAVACGSHDSEGDHVKAVRSLLDKAKIPESRLLCGTHWPLDDEEVRRVAAEARKPTAIENNCSGKHAGFLAVCEHAGFDSRSYRHFEHPIQTRVREVLANCFKTEFSDCDWAIDGCGVPTYRISLLSLAFGFAQLSEHSNLSPEYRHARVRLMKACMDEPFYVGGSRRFCTQQMVRHRGNLLIKVGAEGLYCAAFPRLGLGIALKCDDGANRAAKVIADLVVTAVLCRDQPRPPHCADRNVYDCNGDTVGSIVESAKMSDFCEKIRDLAEVRMSLSSSGG